MKVIHNCKYYPFHIDFCINIHNELLKRGHESIISDDERYYNDADFTIQPDQACKRQGGLGIFINHCFPFCPQKKFLLEDDVVNNINNNSDYIFAPSENYKEWYEVYGLPVKVVGMPKLDNLFNIKKDKTTIFYAPTHNENLTSLQNVKIEELKKYGDVIFRGHPAFYNNEYTIFESFERATIVISDYSSITLDSITLNIPTILFENNEFGGKRYDHISNDALDATISVNTQQELMKTIEKYILEPKYLEEERLKHGKILCENQGNASKILVDTLEGMIDG